MKKVIILAAFLIAVAAHAGYQLYWEFDQSGLSDQIVFKYAKIQVGDDEGVGIGDPDPIYLTFGSDGEIKFTELRHDSYPDPVQGTTIGPNYVELGEFATSAYSFALELYSTGNELVGISDYVSFADLTAFGAVYANMATTGDKAWNFSVRPTPEPTSGLLVLLGIGALALRRKRVHGASTFRHCASTFRHGASTLHHGEATFRHGEATSWSPLSSYT